MMMQYLDVTYLEDTTDKAVLENLCGAILHKSVKPAGICVFLRDIPLVKQQLSDQPISLVTVVNFPQGNASNREIHSQLNEAKTLGVQEVDVVIPYQEFLRDKDLDEVGYFIEMCRCELTSQKLKVILESGALTNEDVYHLSTIACEKGADFIKTSTGKFTIGATIDAVSNIMRAIKEHQSRQVGLKISGGVRTIEQAQGYIDLVQANLGQAWLTPRLLRIGASALFAQL